MSVIAVLASLGSTLIALFVASSALFGIDAAFSASIPVSVCLTGLASLGFGFCALRMDGLWQFKLVTVPWAMVFAVFAIPILLIAPFVFLVKFWVRDVRGKS